MRPLADWSVSESVTLALFGLIVACLIVQRWQRRSPPGASVQAVGQAVGQAWGDIPGVIVLAGALVPWWAWLSDLIVVTGCLLWLGSFATGKWRSRNREPARTRG